MDKETRGWASLKVWHRSGVFGFVWGAPPLLFLADGSFAVQLVVLTATASVVASSGVLLSFLPSAAIAFAIPAVVGSIAGAVQYTATSAAIPVSLMFLTGICVLPSLCRHNLRTVRSIVEAQREARKSATLARSLMDRPSEQTTVYEWESDVSTRMLEPTGSLADLCSSLGIWTSDISFANFVGQLGASPQDVELLTTVMQGGASFDGLQVGIELDGEHVVARFSGTPVFGAEQDLHRGGLTGYRGTILFDSEDVVPRPVERRVSEHDLANLDSLTDLMNRRSFNAELDQAVTTLERHGTGFTVLCLDLDRFKLVNDTFGHPAGDAILMEAARRIRGCVRGSDSVARLGGDEFAVLLAQQCDPGFAARLSARLLEKISEPYEFEDQVHNIGVSIGIAMAPLNGTQSDQLMRNADLALYRSKEDGRGTFRFFEFQMDRDRRERRMLERDLDNAIENKEFTVLFQPIVDANTQHIRVMEALIRWNHPIRGRISPSEFIPVAEQSNCIEAIGRYTLDLACREAMTWTGDCKVAVNISTRHFQSESLINDVAHALEVSGLPAERLEIEVTESVLVDEDASALRTLTRLREIGVSISLDDFGTGYSSLSYILKYPFDKLKIDRAFVLDILEQEAARAILTMIVNLGKSLKTVITVEGVETVEQYDYLRQLGCDQIQGFYFSKPQGADDVREMLRCEAINSNATPKRVSDPSDKRAADAA
ncbi:EAL domain-containing protein [Rhizobiaceae bacterium]|nr:EAL domain-containing protein [Rhizobiaceae bacterium]